MLDTLLLRVQYQTCCQSMCDCSVTGQLLLVDVIAHNDKQIEHLKHPYLQVWYMNGQMLDTLLLRVQY